LFTRHAALCYLGQKEKFRTIAAGEEQAMKTTEKMVSFVKETSYGDFSREVIHQAKRCFLDLIGVALGGARQPLVQILIETLKESGGRPQATVLAHGFKTSLLNAALINGAMAHALDFDDTHIGSIIHPSAPVVPAILAVGEWRGATGKAAMEALIIGFEVETRIGLGLGRKHYDRGWHTTSTCGRFGAAVASGKLLGLSALQMSRAIGLAGTQASGLRLAFGTMTKPFHPGKSAFDGLFSALLARRDFTCAPNMLEGPNGFAEALGDDDTNLNRMVRNLGKKFQILNNTFKPYAACLLTHPTIDGVFELKKRYRLKVSDVDEISCEVARFCLDAAGQKEPKTGLEGKFSIYYCAALPLLEATVGEDMFTVEKVQSPQIVALGKKVKVRVNPSLKDTEARVTITTRDGKKYSAFIDKPKGDPRNPPTDSELESKFRSLAANNIPQKKIDALGEMIWSLEKVQDLRQLIRLCH
jgi:2-methylcitrate dehydratase PrpD